MSDKLVSTFHLSEKGVSNLSIKAVGFDLDDTLYNRGDFYQKVFEVMQSSVAPLDITFETFYPIFQMYSDEEYELFIRRRKDKVTYKNDRVLSTYRYFGKEIMQDMAIVFNSLYLYFRDQLTFRPGVEDLLNDLYGQNITLFILTNGPSMDQRHKLRQLNIARWIPESAWFISDELGFSKPDQEIFQHIDRQLKIKGQEVVYIGDHLQNDLAAANSNGWQAMLIDVHPAELPENVTTYANFLEIQTELHKWLTLPS